jgi:hypothetical protein
MQELVFLDGVGEKLRTGDNHFNDKMDIIKRELNLPCISFTVFMELRNQLSFGISGGLIQK